MRELFDDMRSFYDHFGFRYPPPGDGEYVEQDLAEFRRQFLLEELLEWVEAVKHDDLVGQLDALVDLGYVAVGTMVFHGFVARDWNQLALHVPFPSVTAEKPRALTGEEADSVRSVLEDPVVNYYLAATRRTLSGLHLAREALHEVTFRAVAVARLQGLDYAEAWRRVHRANLLKRRGPSGRSTRWDLVKPEGWTPPDLRDLVKR